MNDYKMRTETYREAVEAYLEGCFADQKCPQQELLQAMRYSLLAGGKRIRPILLLEFCRICGGEWRNALPFAAAIEMVHTYSLIHDDLPCMDNDDYRRGRLTNHKVFGEANAVLAGDALLTAAFETAANAPADAWTIVRIIRILSEAAGANGMVGGQVLDLAGEKIRLEADAIHTIHALKTGALISAACRMGAAEPARRRFGLPMPTPGRWGLHSSFVTTCSTCSVMRKRWERPPAWTAARIPSYRSTAWVSAPR